MKNKSNLLIIICGVVALPYMAVIALGLGMHRVYKFCKGLRWKKAGVVVSP